MTQTASDYIITEFQCMMCGNCCRGEGYVRLRPHDITRIATYLEISETEFIETYTRLPEIPTHLAAGDLWLKDKPGPDQECIMLENNRCRIHPVKPQACQDFPLKWHTPDIMDYCEGMRHQA